MLARLALVVLPLALLTGCGGGDETAAPTEGTTEAATTAPAETTGGGTTTEPEAPARYRLFYLDGERLQAHGVAAEGEPTAQEAVEALVANEEGLTTAIPEGTEVLGVGSGGGTATVDLSRAFESGGGSLSMEARVAQVVYTLTQWPWIDRVTIRLDGEEVEAIGGEGVPARDLGRADFENVVPAILVEAPLPGDEAVSPLGAAGSARVFEANVSLRLEAADGTVLAETFATAEEGAPGRGDFATEVAFEVEEPTEAVLVAYESAADDSGEERHAVRVPVTLCPAGGCRP